MARVIYPPNRPNQTGNYWLITPNQQTLFIETTMKSLDSEHLRVLKNLSVIKRCPLLGGSLTEIVTFGTKNFVRYSRHVRYLGCRLLRGFTVLVCTMYICQIYRKKNIWINTKDLSFQLNIAIYFLILFFEKNPKIV